MRPTINRFFLSLNRRPVFAGIAGLFVAAVATTMATATPLWSTTSRELVDLEFAADQSLRVLVSAPGAPDTGLYSWRSGDRSPKLLCRISGPSTFSFDRSLVMERTAGNPSIVRLYSPNDCRRIARIVVAARVLDSDANARYVAVAVLRPDGRHELRLYSHRGRLISRTAIGRNVELGFSADGRRLVNFDLSDHGPTLLNLPTLAPAATPAWLGAGEHTFVPGSRFVKRYSDNTLSVLSWPSGREAFRIPASRDVRIRELSANGRFGVLHERNASGESLTWIDFASGQRVQLDTGSVDHASIHRFGNVVAWSTRDPEKANQVSVRMQRIADTPATERRDGRTDARQTGP